MTGDLLGNNAYWGAALGLVILLAVFVAALVWMFRPGAAAHYRHDGKIPLNDGSLQPKGRSR